ncbi:unnamed protein product, partial [Effrenium voratum]
MARKARLIAGGPGPVTGGLGHPRAPTQGTHRARACVAWLCLGLATTFVASSTLRRSTSLPRRGEGFTEAPAPKAKSTISREQLERDHGASWELVDKILKGERAASPEAIMRARFTALRFKDPQFLAATEK